MRVAIAQGGGPTAVINASLYGAVAELFGSRRRSMEIWGASGGIAGVLKDCWLDLRKPSRAAWAAIGKTPGAALGSSRKMLNREEAETAVRILRARDVRCFFYIGGNDSMDTALKMAEAAAGLHYELHVAGIPKTIDNDLPHTDHCPGFASAARYFVQSAIDLGVDIRTLPTPVSIMEVLGRNAGWLTAATVAARQDPDDAPHLIYVPEAPLSRERFLADVKEVYERQGWVVVAVSEGLKDESGKSWSAPRASAAVDGFGRALPGDVAATLAGVVTADLGLRARSEKPGLCGRSCALMVSKVDRTEAEGVARFAAAWALKGNTAFMGAIERTANQPYAVAYRPVPLDQVANVERPLPDEYLTADRNNINDCFRAYIEPLLGGPLLRYARLY